MQTFEDSTAQSPASPGFPAQKPPSSNKSCFGWGLGCGVAVALSVLLVCGGGIAALLFAVFGILKSSEPYTRSLATVRQSAEVREVLGEPLEEAWVPTGSIDLNDETGSAELAYSVSGPEGSGQVELDAVRENGRWKFNRLVVKPSNGTTEIDLTEVVNDASE